MFSRVRLYAGSAVMAAALGFGSFAGAATTDLSISRYDRTELSDVRKAVTDFQGGASLRNLRTETFEGHRAWDGRRGSSNPAATRVGGFRAIGKTGSGRSMVNKGRAAEVRGDSSMRWGRYNTSNAAAGLGGHWLDSNDNQGLEWRIRDVGRFNTVAFVLSDVADVGARFSIKVGGTLYSDLAASQRLTNGNLHFVQIALSQAVDTLTVRLMNDRSNDGFGIDAAMTGFDTARGGTVAPVPIPPAALFLLTGIAVLAGTSRRRLRKA